MAARSRGNGTNFGWLKKSCDINTCDLSPDGNPEKYGWPLKSAISNSFRTSLVLTASNGRSFTDVVSNPCVDTQYNN